MTYTLIVFFTLSGTLMPSHSVPGLSKQVCESRAASTTSVGQEAFCAPERKRQTQVALK